MDAVEVLLWSELVAVAGSVERARRLVTGGSHRRVLRGAYVAAELPDTPEVRCEALRRVLPAGVALSGRAALWAVGVDERAGRLRGVVAARMVLPNLEPRSESQGESRLRMGLVLGGVPRPQAQVDYHDEDGRHLARVDLVVKGVLLEYDGREQRLLKPVFVHDRRRQNAVVERGAELRRFSSEDVAPARRTAARARHAPDARPASAPDRRRQPPRRLRLSRTPPANQGCRGRAVTDGG